MPSSRAVEKARRALEADYEFRRVEVVGPTVSSELAWAGTMGVLASLRGDADLHLDPVRVAVRPRRHHLDAPRRDR